MKAKEIETVVIGIKQQELDAIVEFIEELTPRERKDLLLLIQGIQFAKDILHQTKTD